MDGYFGDPEATAYAFRGGWFHTGDLVSMDEDGFLFFHRRRKDMIRRSGENISASEVEEIIQQHPAVLLAACVAVPDDLRGEEIKAFVVLRTGTDPVILSTSLPEYCEARLAYFKVPRYWEARRELPLTPSSKVAKSELTMLATAPPITGWDKVEGVWR
jgi:crotonobetaine/carnitine-CoA ligase